MLLLVTVRNEIDIISIFKSISTEKVVFKLSKSKSEQKVKENYLLVSEMYWAESCDQNIQPRASDILESVSHAHDFVIC